MYHQNSYKDIHCWCDIEWYNYLMITHQIRCYYMQQRSWGGMKHDYEIGYCSVGGKKRERGGNERRNEWNRKAKRQPSVSHISTQMQRERHEQGIRTRWVKGRERQRIVGGCWFLEGGMEGGKALESLKSAVNGFPLAHLYHTYSSLEQVNILECWNVKSCSYYI